MANEFRIKNGFESQGNSNITGSLIVTTGVTASLQGTASWAQNAITASFITTAQTASYVLNAVSASRATSASRADSALSASFATTAATASYILNAVSASFATSASRAVSASRADSALSSSFATTAATASYVLNSVSASFSNTASYVNTLNQNVNIFKTLNVSASGGIKSLTVGDNHLVVSSSGGVVIGSTNPWKAATSLTVSGSAGIIASTVNTEGPVLNILGNSTFGDYASSIGISKQGTSGTSALSLITYGTASTAVSADNLAVSGNVDIQATPIGGSTTSVPKMFIGTGNESDLYLYTNFSTKIFISASASSKVGIATTSPKTTLDISGSFSGGYRTIGAAVLTGQPGKQTFETDYIVTFTASGAGIGFKNAIVLPDPPTLGRVVILQRITGSAACNIVTTGSALINDAATYAFPTTLYTQRTFVCNGVDWYTQP